MVVFQDIEDVEEWLEPLDYIALWEAVAPYALFSIDDREHCDGLIAGAKVKPATILKGLKGMALLGLRDKFGLTHRRYEPLSHQAIRSIH